MLLELLVQDPEMPAEMAELGNQLSSLVIVGLGAAASALMGVLRKAVPLVDGLPPMAKSAVIVILVAAGQVITGLTGIEGLPANPLDFDVGSITLILSSLSSMGLHAVYKAVKPKDVGG